MAIHSCFLSLTFLLLLWTASCEHVLFLFLHAHISVQFLFSCPSALGCFLPCSALFWAPCHPSMRSKVGDVAEGPPPDWSRWHIFWADERVVPLDHADSNYAAALPPFLSQVCCRTCALSALGFISGKSRGLEKAPEGVLFQLPGLQPAPGPGTPPFLAGVRLFPCHLCVGLYSVLCRCYHIGSRTTSELLRSWYVDCDLLCKSCLPRSDSHCMIFLKQDNPHRN